MDSLTHIALGACIGEAFAGKKIGRPALAWGGLAHSLPDIDFLSGLWLDAPAALLAHRGITHSWFFVLVVSALLVFPFRLSHPKRQMKSGFVFLFFSSAMGLHILLDSLNNYGTGWWEPFNHTRVSFNTLFVVDPLFSIVPGICFLILVIRRATAGRRAVVWKTGLTVPAIYIMISFFFREIIQSDVSRILARQGISYERFMTAPVPFQTVLHYTVIQCEGGYYIGYRSIFDKQENLQLCYILQRKGLLELTNEPSDAELLRLFSQGYFSVDSIGDDLYFHDLRFGEIQGWTGTYKGPIFSYNLSGGNDPLVLQRGRSADLNLAGLRSLWKRMKGL
ncbi:MAG: metal-dependent hydrolase [Chitinophagaceae bacterium]|nr:MAG: metal-dependent hydrolase [Chitinophagaceae bacterium]